MENINIFIINEERIKDVYIFTKENTILGDSIKLDITDSLEDYKEYINDSEIFKLDTNKSKIYLVQIPILDDDSIESIKQKIVVALDLEYLSDELYLFYLQNQKHHSGKIYNIISQNENLDPTIQRLVQYISNIVGFDYSKIDEIPNDEKVTFEDVLSLNLDDKTFITKKPMGQKFTIDNKYPVAVCPFDSVVFDEFLQKYSENIVSTQPNNDLLEYNPILSNSIYVCLAEDVFNYMKENDLPQEEASKLYFPYLSMKGISNIDSLREEKNALLDAQSEKLDEDRVSTKANTIAFLQTIGSLNRDKIEVIHNGIQYIHMELKQLNNFSLPLELIFKIIHTNKDVPFIKYNPGSRREKLFRLYSEASTKTGKKIPVLRKALIFRLSRELAKNKSIGFLHI